MPTKTKDTLDQISTRRLRRMIIATEKFVGADSQSSQILRQALARRKHIKKCKWCHGAKHVTPAQLTKYLTHYAQVQKAKKDSTVFAFVALYLTVADKLGRGRKVCYVCPGCEG